MKKKKSAGASKCAVEKLWDCVQSGHLITVTFHTGVDLTCHIFFVDVTLGLRLSAESYNFQNKTVVHSPIRKLDGIEVNNHVAIFGGELHSGVRFL